MMIMRIMTRNSKECKEVELDPLVLFATFGYCASCYGKIAQNKNELKMSSEVGWHGTQDEEEKRENN